jgi:hypothetical protein
LLCCALRGFALIYVEDRGTRSKWISRLVDVPGLATLM